MFNAEQIVEILKLVNSSTNTKPTVDHGGYEIGKNYPNRWRIRVRGPFYSDETFGNNGMFNLPHQEHPKQRYIVIASDGKGWEHVSVHVGKSDGSERTPTWDEMCYIKSVFWDEEDCVVQYHPRRSEYITAHSHTLHLWRPTGQVLPEPPSILIGAKTMAEAVDMMSRKGWSQGDIEKVLKRGNFEG